MEPYNDATVAKIEERMDNYERHLDVAEIDTIWNSINP